MRLSSTLTTSLRKVWEVMGGVGPHPKPHQSPVALEGISRVAMRGVTSVCKRFKSLDGFKSRHTPCTKFPRVYSKVSRRGAASRTVNRRSL